MKFFLNAATSRWIKSRAVGTSALVAVSSLLIGGSVMAPSIAQQTPRTSPSPSPSTASIEALERAIHTQINQYRRDQGLPPLTLDPRISEQARSHSQAMAAGRVTFGHDGFNQRGTAIRRSIIWNSIAENVATNQGYSNPDRQAVTGWLNSSGHRQNIQGQYNLTGIGVARNSRGQYYFTQIFVRSRQN